MSSSTIPSGASARPVPACIQALIERGALFVANHSGGKDSQAMFAYLRAHVPAAQIRVVHADLGRVEWAGALTHIEATVDGVPVDVARSRRDLLQMIEERGMFPSPSLRQCTSDLKRGPIERQIRAIVRDRIASGMDEARAGLIVNCMGMRAQESSSRAKLEAFKLSERNSKAGREWYDWLPIHDWTIGDVFGAIAAAGQQPHPIYATGMSRFSCCFCVMANQADLKTAARLSVTNPELFNDPGLYREYVRLERATGQVMLMPKKGVRLSLEEVTGVYVDKEAVAA